MIKNTTTYFVDGKTICVFTNTLLIHGILLKQLGITKTGTVDCITEYDSTTEEPLKETYYNSDGTIKEEKLLINIETKPLKGYFYTHLQCRV
ncbi:DUF2963 domain-containing protein [Areca yellow leaf disease phytoplasma]|uniref:DUF2963 domain-containing protein n=1 Tax=Areca yellow leaf disease phytoplasma TaxID=927614 RepID=UPI0035B55CA2